MLADHVKFVKIKRGVYLERLAGYVINICKSSVGWDVVIEADKKAIFSFSELSLEQAKRNAVCVTWFISGASLSRIKSEVFEAEEIIRHVIRD